jgi:hypothetical protein
MDRRAAIASAGGGWTPSALNPLAWWYANASYLVFSSGSLVTQWRDRSGNANHVDSSGASWPTFDTTAWSGRPAMLFDGAASFLRAASGTLLSAVNGADAPFSVFFTLQFNTAAPDHGLCQWVEVAGNSLSQVRTNSTGSTEQTRYQRRDSTGTTVTRTGTASVQTEKSRLAWIFNGTAITTYVNGTLDLNASSCDVGTMAFTEFVLGKSDIGQLDGKMPECVVLPYAATAAQWNAYLTYSLSEWP